MTTTSGKVVALTGASGTLGTRLFRRLEDRPATTVHAFAGDLRDGDAVTEFIAVTKPTHVFHLGAVVDLSLVDGAQDAVLAINVGGTANIGQAIVAAELDAPWLCYASSSHVYAATDAPIAESHPTGPRNFYGLTKLLGEQVMTHYGAQAGATVCVGRIFSLWDERQTGGFLVPATRRRLEGLDPGQPVPVINGDSVRDFSHADDLASSLVRLMDAGASATVNVGSGRGIRVVDLLAHAIGPPWTFEAAPGGVVDAIVADIRLLQELSADAP